MIIRINCVRVGNIDQIVPVTRNLLFLWKYIKRLLYWFVFVFSVLYSEFVTVKKKKKKIELFMVIAGILLSTHTITIGEMVKEEYTKEPTSIPIQGPREKGSTEENKTKWDEKEKKKKVGSNQWQTHGEEREGQCIVAKSTDLIGQQFQFLDPIECT